MFPRSMRISLLGCHLALPANATLRLRDQDEATALPTDPQGENIQYPYYNPPTYVLPPQTYPLTAQQLAQPLYYPPIDYGVTNPQDYVAQDQYADLQLAKKKQEELDLQLAKKLEREQRTGCDETDVDGLGKFRLDDSLFKPFTRDQFKQMCTKAHGGEIKTGRSILDGTYLFCACPKGGLDAGDAFAVAFIAIYGYQAYKFLSPHMKKYWKKFYEKAKKRGTSFKHSLKKFFGVKTPPSSAKTPKRLVAKTTNFSTNPKGSAAKRKNQKLKISLDGSHGTTLNHSPSAPVKDGTTPNSSPSAPIRPAPESSLITEKDT